MKKIIVILMVCLLSVSLFSQIETKTYKIGDIGSGGGIVFYIDGDTYLETSEILGEADWDDAFILAENYRGGGYSDWYLPTKDELNYIYENLRKKDIITGKDFHWSSSEYHYNIPWIQRFSDGYQFDSINGKQPVIAVRAVRKGLLADNGSANSDVASTISAKTKNVQIGEEILIEGGTFVMGSPEGTRYSYDDEQPVHEVSVSSFYMGTTEITQKQYRDVMGKNPSENQPATDWQTLPVEKVSWYDAAEFCNALSDSNGLEPYYVIDKVNKDPNNKNIYDNLKWTIRASNVSGAEKGYRLPTEAEWEYAAQGGQKEGDNRFEYAGTNTMDTLDNYAVYDIEKTQTVGTKQANSLGLYDMSGNVNEWCWDWYADYTNENQTNPTGATTGKNRIRRGGSYYSSNAQASCRVASRLNLDPHSSNYGYNGFRVVRSR